MMGCSLVFGCFNGCTVSRSTPIITIAVDQNPHFGSLGELMLNFVLAFQESVQLVFEI